MIELCPMYHVTSSSEVRYFVLFFFDSGDICLLRNNLVYNLDTNVVGIPGEAWWVWKKYMFSPSPTLSENMSAIASLSEILRYHLYQ